MVIAENGYYFFLHFVYCAATSFQGWFYNKNDDIHKNK